MFESRCWVSIHSTVNEFVLGQEEGGGGGEEGLEGWRAREEGKRGRELGKGTERDLRG